MDLSWLPKAIAIALPLLYIAGAYSAYHAIMHSRTSQGSTAWVLSLLVIPYIALPLYWTFGRVKYYNYTENLNTFNENFEKVGGNKYRKINEEYSFDKNSLSNDKERDEFTALENLSGIPFTSNNKVNLLINGDKTFDAILESINEAKDYILVQYYIIHDDKIGTSLKDHLINSINRGVRVMLLYDALGCIKLPDAYLEELTSAGAKVSRFSGRRGWFKRLRLNFRNHRKIVVIDGNTAFMGGLNVGDEYLGRDKKFGFWRDTHLKVSGPIVQSLQIIFLRDWYFGIKEIPDLIWQPKNNQADQCALITASGPNDALETCGLLFVQCIESAQSRLWIATPYFIPDDRVLAALQLAALRGVDVRVMMPRKTDSFMFKYAPYAYLKDIESVGAKIYLYEKGFMHQKVLLVDEKYSAIGTANMDNRSFRLNFEVITVVRDKKFCQESAKMLEEDFSNATRIEHKKLENPSWRFNFATHLIKLIAPIL